MNLYPFFVLLLFFFFACGDAGNEKKAGEATASAPPPVPKTVFNVEPGLIQADSLQVLYFDNPDGDSLRYTRYFRLMETGDTAKIKTLLREMNQVYVQEPNVRPCRSEGKLYLLKGENILRTVYFSSRGDSCTYFYFIKDGLFYYFPQTEAAADWLKAEAQRARKP